MQVFHKGKKKTPSFQINS